MDRSREGAGAQGNGEVLRLFGRELAADAGRTARDLFLNHRSAVDGPVQHDGEALADMFAGGHFKQGRTARGERQADHRSVFIVESGAGVGHFLAAQERGAVERQFGVGRFAVLARHGIESDAGRQIALGNVVADEVEGQIGGLLDELDGTVDVGQAGKLDEDAVALLLADIRFRHAELVDAAGDGTQHLIHGQILRLFNEGRRERVGQVDRAVGPGTGRSGHDLRGVLLGEGKERIDLVGAGDDEFLHAAGHLAGAKDGDPCLTGLLAKHLPAVDECGLNGFFRIHAQRELNAAFEIEAQTDAGRARQVDVFRHKRRRQEEKRAGHDNGGNRISEREFHESLSHGCRSRMLSGTAEPPTGRTLIRAFRVFCAGDV